MNGVGSAGDTDPSVGVALVELHRVANLLPPASVAEIVDVVARLVGAEQGRLYVADYGLRSLRRLGQDGPLGAAVPIGDSIQGRVFADGTVVRTGTSPVVLHVPLTDGIERLGILELDFAALDGVPAVLSAVVPVLVSVLLAKSRYSDAWARCRRAEHLSPAAEVQWDLLPPLAASARHVAVAGILEPAYDIGGDSFDYALNHDSLDFAIVDAVGHGMSAVLLAAAAINGLRNVRRSGGTLSDAYRQVDAMLVEHFGDCRYVTAQFGRLDHDSGVLQWINAGHPLPLLVRNGTFAGPLACTPSMPMGLGGPIVQIAEEPLQSGDRLLFFTDGITESRSATGGAFGEERLADYLVRATLEALPVSETVRRLSAHILDFVGDGLNDDATMFLVEHRVPSVPREDRRGARPALADGRPSPEV